MGKQVGYAEALNTSRPPSKKSGRKELRSIEIEKAEGGGAVVTHRFKQGDGEPYHESEGPHVFGASEGKKLMAHLVEHLGIKAEAEGEGEEE